MHTHTHSDTHTLGKIGILCTTIGVVRMLAVTWHIIHGYKGEYFEYM